MQFILHIKHFICIIKTNRLTLLEEITAADSRNNIMHITVHRVDEICIYSIYIYICIVNTAFRNDY
jgi:hypothetical protein